MKMEDLRPHNMKTKTPKYENEDPRMKTKTLSLKVMSSNTHVVIQTICF